MEQDKQLIEDLKLENNVFRERIRSSRIPKWYWGPGHILFNGTLLFGSIFYYINKVQNPSFWEASPLFIVLLVGNLAVFLIHKFPLHGRYWWNSYAFSNHTKTHHVFYRENSVTWKNKRDWFTMFFPPEVVLGFILVYHPFFYFLLKPIIGVNGASFYLMASSAYFILYEIVHYTSHLPSEHWALKIPGLMYMRRHHQLHHDPRLMGNYNFCIVYPLFDILFGTHVNDQNYEEITGKSLPGNGNTPV